MDIQKVFFSKEFLLALLALGLLGWLCLDGLSLMVDWWDREEYSHGFLIPVVAVYLVWQKRFSLAQHAENGSYWGIVCLFLAIFAWLLGELSAIYTIIQYAFFIGVFAISLLWVGLRGTRVIFAALFYLIFMIPLPNFIFFNLSQELQLISSSLGVAVVRLFDISVFLEGNVIDLGSYQLQVVEACNGLRYLFPLMSFGYLIAYIYRGPFWQKAIIFLSTIPITVLMNSFRIGVIGVTVEYYGIAAAEGFLHDFEGWIVFMACLGVLLFEIWIFYLLSKKGRSFGDLFDLDFGVNEGVGEANSNMIQLVRPAVIGLIALLLSIPAANYVSDREDLVPDRQAFSMFPLYNDGWVGKESSLTEAELDVLLLTDYFIGDYKKVGGSLPVNFYTAWYQEQRKGASIHSPKSCLPGGGWVIQSHTIDTLSFDAIQTDLNVNRVVMQMAEHQQLVYYWFHGRNRNITNEYLAKWYIFWDSLTRSRTDGALMRLVTYVPEDSDILEADARMQNFLQAFYPVFSDYIPD